MSSEYHELSEVMNKSKEPATTEPEKSAEPEVQEAVESDTTPTTPEVEEEVSEEAALAESEEDTTTETPVEPESTQHRSKAAEKRIAKLIREREQLKGQLALYQQTTQPQEQVITQQEIDLNLPNPDNYALGTDDIDYRLDLREHQRNQLRKTQDFQARIAEAAKNDPELKEMMEEDVATHRTLPPNATTIELLKESPVSVELFRFLIANPDIANSISKMSPTQTAREIGKIEIKLEEKAKVTAPSTTKKTVALPPPISPTKSSKAVTPKPSLKYSVY